MLERTDAITNEVLESVTFVLAYPTLYIYIYIYIYIYTHTYIYEVPHLNVELHT